MVDSRAALKKDLFSLPVEWTWQWLTEVISIEGGTQPPASTFSSSYLPGYVRLVQIRDFETDAHITFIPDSKKWRKCGEKDVLIARYGAALGRICRGLAGAYNVALAKVVPSEAVDTHFIYYLLRSSHFQGPVLAMGGRSAQAGFNKDGLSVIPVPVPPLPEQRAIAATLGALDDKIELNRKLNATLEAMARALFRDWFVDFGPTRAKMAGSAPHLSPDLWSLFPDRLDGEGKPEGWETSQLLELARLISGGTPKTDNPEFWDGGISWASAKDVSQCKDAFLVHTDRNISEAGLKNSATKIVPRNSTVIVARGATTGRSCLFGSDIAMNQTCYALASRYGQPLWLNCAFGELVDRLVNAAHGSVFDTITTRTLEGISLVAGPLNLRAAFEEIVAPLFARILANIHESRTLAQTRDLLLPRLMSGELRVAEAERIVSEVA